MTSFAFIAGLIPLVFATGAGALGNRTIGTASAGGMLVGTVVGVMVIPGLYYLFARISDGRKLLGDEVDEPLSELLEHEGSNGVDRGGLTRSRSLLSRQCATACSYIEIRGETEFSMTSWPIVRHGNRRPVIAGVGHHFSAAALPPVNSRTLSATTDKDRSRHWSNGKTNLSGSRSFASLCLPRVAVSSRMKILDHEVWEVR